MTTIVTLIVGFTTVFIALTNVQRQIRVTARETWLREFRDQYATLMSHYAAYLQHLNQFPPSDEERRKEKDKTEELGGALLRPFNVLRLLIAERGPEYAIFVPLIWNLLLQPKQAANHGVELDRAGEEIVQRERAAIDAEARWRPWTPLLPYLRETCRRVCADLK